MAMPVPAQYPATVYLFGWAELWCFQVQCYWPIVLYVHLHHGTKLTTCVEDEEGATGMDSEGQARELNIPVLSQGYKE